VDREAELAGLSERALQGRNTRLVAPRRYGKTLLLRHLIATQSPDRAIGVYVDLYGVIGTLDVVAREQCARPILSSRAAGTR